MSIFTLLYIILNIIVAIKTRNLEQTKEIYDDDFDDHIAYKDSLNKFYLNTAPPSKKYESDLVEIQEIKPWHKTKRSAIEENKMSFVSPKPTRRERHRGSLKQDEHLKLPHFKMINKTIDKTDVYNDEVMKSNTDPYTFEEINDTGIKKTNDTTIHHSLSDEIENSDLDIKKDNLIQSTGPYPKNVLKMSRFSNENIGVNNTQSSSYIARNDNTKVIGINDMPLKYISVVKDPKTMILNTKSEIATINDQMINKNTNNQEEIIERYDTEVIAEQYDQEPNRINIKSLEMNGNNYQNLLRAGQIFQHQVLMEGNDARFLEEQNKDNPNPVNKVYQKLLRTVPRLYHQELMERSGTRFVTEQYNEDYANKPYNTDQKLLRAGQENNHKGLMESHSSGLIAKQYEDYLNQPHNMYEKILRDRQENNHQERMESSDAGIIAGKYYNEDRNRPNRKSIEINERIRHIRPRIDLQEPMERKDFKIEEEENDRDQDQETKTLETNEHIYQKLLESSPRFDHQGLMERNDAKIVPGPFNNEDINRLNTKSIDINGHVRHKTPKFNHQELMERKSDTVEAEQYKKDPLNAKTMGSNKHNYQKSLESNPRFNHQEIMEKGNGEFEAGEYAIHRNPPKMKSLETNGRNYQKISEARPSLGHQGLMERHGAGMIAEEYSKGDPNQRNIKSFTSHQVLIKEEGSNIIETEQNKRDPNESNMKSSEISNPNTIQNLSGAIERPKQQKHTEENDIKMFSEQYYEEYSNQLNMNPFGGIANIDEPIFEDIGNPEKELKGRDNAEIVAKYKEDLFAANMKGKDTSNSHMDKQLTEAARSELKLMVLNNADIRHDTGPEHYKEYSNQPNTNSLNKNTNNHKDTFEERYDKPINLDQKEVIDVIYPRLVHYIPRIKPLVVIPRFECRLVPSCSRFYLPKRCTILEIKCGFI